MLKIFAGLVTFITLIIVYFKIYETNSNKLPPQTNAPPLQGNIKPVAEIPWRSFTNDMANTAITVKNISLKSKDPVIAFRNYGSPHQQLFYGGNSESSKEIIFKHSGKCLTTRGDGSKPEDLLLIQDTCSTDPKYMWFYKNGQLINERSPERCVTIDLDGETMFMGKCDPTLSSRNQIWRYER